MSLEARQANPGGTGFRVAMSRVQDHLVTFGLSLAGTLAGLFVVALLARALSESAFLEFSVINRYFGFFAIAANLGLAFPFMRFADAAEPERTRSLAKFNRWCIFLACLVLSLVWAVYWLGFQGVSHQESLWQIACFLWVWSQAQFHLSAPYSRHVGGMSLYGRLYVLSKVAGPFAGAVVAAVTGRYELFFIVYAAVSLLVQHHIWRSNQERALVERAREVLLFGASRWLESMLRASLPVVLITATHYFLGNRIAGGVAIIYTLSKALESLLQPVVMSIMLRQSATTDEKHRKTGVAASLILATALMILVYVLQQPVIWSINLFLGQRYSYLTTETWIVLIGAGPLIALNLVRALNDNHFQHSPMVYINTACLVLIVVATALCRNLVDVAVLILILHTLRFVLYLVFIGLKAQYR